MISPTPEKFVDYDAAFADLAEAGKPLVRRLFGRDWELPGVIPAAAVLRLARTFSEGRTEQDLTTGETLMLASDMIPPVVLDEWLRLGLSTDQLGVIIEDLIGVYGPQLGGGDSDPEATAPETGESTSSSPIGASSKPTSHASTASIFQVG